MKAHSSYKSSQADWLGDIPNHWNVKRIKFVFEIRKRIAGQEGFNVLSITQKGIKIKDIETGAGQLATDYSGYQLVEIGDFAMNQMDLLTGFVDISRYQGVTSPDYRVFSLTDDNCAPKFLLYILQHCYTNKIFFRLGHGSSQLGRWRLPTDEFNDFKLPMPPLPEQQAIADFLDRKTAQIDTLIEKKQRQIDLLQEQRTALINHAVTKGLNPKVKMKDSGVEWLGEIPSHWEVLPLKRVIKKFVDYRGHTPVKTDSGVLLITAKNIRDGRLDFEKSKEYIAEDGYSDWMVRGMPEKGDVLVTTEAPLGATAQIESEYVALAQRLILLKADKEQVDNTFLKYYFLSQAGQDELYSQSTGSTAIGIKASKFYNINTVIPPLNEQQEIAEHLAIEEENISSLIQKIERIIEYLKEYRTALISEAVTGKVDVRTVHE